MTAPAADQQPGPAVTKPEQPEERLPDMEVITGEGGTVTIDGIACTVRPVKTKAFRALMELFYVGIGPALSQIRLNFSAGAAEVAAEVAGLLMIAMRNAHDEAMRFLLTVLDAGEDQDRLRDYLMDDPDPLELIEAVEAVLTQEAPHITEILGKAHAAWTRVAPLYQTLIPKRDSGTGSGDDGRSPRHST